MAGREVDWSKAAAVVGGGESGEDRQTGRQAGSQSVRQPTAKSSILLPRLTAGSTRERVVVARRSIAPSSERGSPFSSRPIVE